ncbi:Intracellular distribution of mitochondria [Recurvomyces mirabilis]|uniref:Clustered mitochondria protein homolog n=1 Tax=Recurvomyces mirabilis TaxID=574656 RepID=A0AAE0WN02_9PEZI|nr:Intracellular distribution of mitochondria [Recurvomyces mirabilis]KAK5152737.1 Intracellular distribution of mitochondria [Recurvomyces mirabilis]
MAETSTNSKPSTTNGTEDTTTTTNGHATSDALTNGTSDDASKETGETDDATQAVDNVLKLRVDLPTHEHVDIIVSSQEQVQEIRQSIVDQPHTFQYSCFHLEYQGKRINDFVELAEVEGIVKDTEPVLKLVEDAYTEAQARMHVVRVRELIGAAGNRVDYVSGIDAGTSLCEDVEMAAGDNNNTGGKDDSSPVAHYDLNAPAPISALLPRQREAAPKTVKSISLSAWNPPPYHHRMRGHLLYLVVTTLEGDQHYITSHITGFYVNRSTNAKFDPEPRQMSKTSRAHSLITLLSEISDKFAGQFVRLQEYNGQRDPLASYALSNSIPAAPWLVSPTSMQHHQPDATRPQEPYLLAGADNAETLRDWNEEFQSTRELPKETVQDRVFRERLTSKLFAEYNEAAVRGAVLVGRGEVQPLNPTEARDAQIFVYNNVFYSFGADGVGTFASDGGDEAARVATGKDVQGVKAVNQLDITGLFTPGTVVVDYLGKRIVGQSIVPGIFKQRDPGEHQIDYGGVEGKDVIATHEGFANPFAELSKAMRVKRHAVWDKEVKRHELEASVETKGLLGTDGRKYVLDLYRVTPLDVKWLEEHRGTEQIEEGRYPHRMAVLRAELVDSWRIAKLREFISGELERKRGEKEKANDETEKLTNGKGEKHEETDSEQAEKKQSNGEVEEKKESNGENEEKKEAGKQQETVDVSGFSFSLNPDVFSGQQPQTEEEKAEMDKDEADVRAVCAYLADDVIPRLVRDIQEGEVGFPMDGQNLVRDMHKRGINARYLGVLAQKAKDLPAASEEQKDDKRLQLLVQLAQQEMVARAFKHVCVKFLRSLPACFAQNCIAHLLNCLLGAELNGSPKPEIDEAMKAMYNEADFEFLDVTPEKLAAEIQRQVALRFRYEVGKEIVPAGKHLQMLREVCLKLGFQLEAKDYQFGKDAVPSQPLQQKASAESLEVPQTNGVHPPTEGGNKKKKKKLQAEHSPNRAASASPTAPTTTFQPENILNVVPIVKEASPRSMLAEEALDAGRMSIQQDQKELGQELLLESLSLHEQIYGILHPEVARVYYALSTLYYGLEEKNAAVELAKKAVIVSERTLGVDNAETILAYLNLSLMEHATGNTKNALALVRHALDLWKLVYGPHHPDSITTLNNAAVMLQTLKQFPESRKWFQSSLEICTDVAGKNSVNTATLLFQYAQALALDHDPRQAVERMRESYLVFRDLLGAENQNTKEAGAWLDTLARSAVNQEKAAKEASNLLNSGTGRQRMLLRGAGGSTGGRLGVGSTTGKNGVHGSASGQSAEAQVQAHARATSSGGLDQRSLDELVKYVNGSAEQQGRTTPKKKVVGNPKRRQQRAE